MKNNEMNSPDDARLGALLREAHPACELVPGFQNAVWCRVALAEGTPRTSWLDALACWVMRPRFAVGGLAAAIALGALLGGSTGDISAKNSAQARYVAAVNPFEKQR